MRLIYLASPYSTENQNLQEFRVREVQRALAYFANNCEGILVYSPISHWHQVAHDHSLPKDFQFWRERDFFMIDKASAVWVLCLDGWEQSYGVRLELEYADSRSKSTLLINTWESDYILTERNPS